MHTDLQLNVAYCLTHVAALSKLAPKKLASTLEVDTSTIVRWKSFIVKPRDDHVSVLAMVVGIDKDKFYLPHQDFVELIANLNPSIINFATVEPSIVLGSIEKWRHRWTECHHRHHGSYVLYTRIISTDTAAKSLLRIKNKTVRGISFDIFNVDDRYNSHKPSIYIYEGLVFPIYECLAFYAEERSLDEPLSIVSSSSQVDTPTVLTGYLVAVGVSPESRTPTGTKIILEFQNRNVLDVGDILNTLGIRKREEIKIPIRRLLFE